MDPEVIAQLEEQLRTMNELLAQQNSMMAAQMGAMKNAGGKLNAAAGGFAKGMGANEQANTKYAEAQAKATESSEKWDKAARNSQMALTAFSLAVSGTTNVLGSLGGALLSAEKGFGKYGGTVDAAASAAQGLASALPVVGEALGALVGVAGQIASKVVGDALRLTDSIISLRDETVKTAGALPTTSEGLLKLANDAKYYGDNIQVLGKITQGLGTGLVTLGKTAGDGAVKFMELANVSEETRQAFGKMGISQEQLTEMQATYIKQQQSSGLAYLSQNKSIDQLRKESLKYAENLNALSSLTGKQADALRAEQDIAAAVMQEKIAQRQDLVELKRLKDAGLDAEAKDLEAKMKSMADYRDTMSNLVGPEQTALYMNYMRTGVYNNISAPLAVLGADLDTARTQLQRGADGMKVAAQSADDLTAKQSQMSTNLGQAALHMDEQSLASTGLLKDSMGRLNDTFDQSAEERLAAARKIQEERKAGSPMDDAIEKARSVERQLQQKYQEFLIDGIKKAAALINQTDLMDTAMKVATGGLIALGAGIAAMAAASIAGWAIEQKIKRDAKAAQQDFTKALRESAAAMKQQTSASRDATRADTAEARASGSAASADRSESAASNRARAADIAEARASGSAASADRTEAAASRRAASADMREAAASQRAATADMREAAASMKAAAADLREAKASDAAARADMRESMSGGGGGFGGGGKGGKGGKLLNFAKGAAIAGGLAYGADALFGAAGVGKNLDAENIQSQDDKNWERASVWEKTQSSIARGIEHIGRFMFLDNIANQAQADRVKSETEYLTKKYGPEAAKPAAAGGIEEANKAAIASQLDILGSISSPGGVENMTPEQLAALGITPEVAPVVAQEPGTSEKEKAAQAEQAKSASYTIQKGDTLSQLAEKYGTTVEALMEANKQITNKDLIYEGAQLNIPGQEKLDNEYTVKKGDTLRKIAEQYGMNYEDLLKANPNLKNKDWKEGYKLNIPNQLGSASEFLDPAALAQLGLGGAGGISTLPTDPNMMGQIGMLPTALGGAGITPFGGMGMPGYDQTDLIEHQIEKNEELFGQPLRDAAEKQEQQKQVFSDLNGTVTTLSGSVNAFKKNVDGTTLALSDLIDASDQLYEAMTGQKRQRSDGSNPGGAPGDGKSTVSGVDPEKIKQATAFFEGQGWTKEQAAGLVGNLITESKLDPNAVGDGGKAYGIAQWHPDRQLEFKKWSGQDIQGSSFQKQLEFIDYELRGGKEQKAGKALAATTSASEAAMVVDKQYERSTGAALAERQANAEQIASGNFGGLAGQYKDRAGPKNLATIQAQGKSTQVSSEAADHFQNLLNHLTDVGYKINSLGGYNDRNIAGTNTKSAHARGLAIDINPSTNPHGSSLITDLPSSAVNFARKSGLGWGGDWKSSKDAMHFSAQKNEGGWVQAERGGIFKGPDSGYPAILHGKEAVVPLDNKFTRSQSFDKMSSKMAAIQDKLSFDKISKMPGATVSSEYTVNGKPVDKKAYDSFMRANPELQNIQQKVQSMLGTISNDKLDPAKIINSMSRLMDNNLTGVKDEVIDKNKKIQDSLIQLVSKETNKALQAINETNQPMQNAATAITNSMQTVMKAHTSSMNELSYRLGQMVDAMETSNDVTKKILKKASA